MIKMDYDLNNSTNETLYLYSNNTTTTIIGCDDYDDVLSTVYFQTFIHFSYITIMILSIIGNGIVCYLVQSATRMRSVTNFFIVNLSVGDMLMTLLCIPFSFMSVLVLRYWPFGDIVCRIVSYWQAISVFVSAYTLVAISIDRYMAIMWPLRPRMSKSHAKIIIALVWIIAFLTALPILIVSSVVQPDEWFVKCERYICEEVWAKEEHRFYYTMVLMILQYAVPFFVLVYTYARIAVVVWGKKTPGEAENTRDQRMAKSKRKMIKMMVTVVIVFTICWLPYNVMSLTLNIDAVQSWQGIPYLWFSLHWLAMSHTCYNPVIYAYMNHRFRIGFINILSKFPCTRYLIPAEHNRGTSISGFAMTGVDPDSTSLQRANTCTTYISVRRKNNGALAPKSSVFKNHHGLGHYRPNHQIERFIEDAI